MVVGRVLLESTVVALWSLCSVGPRSFSPSPPQPLFGGLKQWRNGALHSVLCALTPSSMVVWRFEANGVLQYALCTPTTLFPSSFSMVVWQFEAMAVRGAAESSIIASWSLCSVYAHVPPPRWSFGGLKQWRNGVLRCTSCMPTPSSTVVWRFEAMAERGATRCSVCAHPLLNGCLAV